VNVIGISGLDNSVAFKRRELPDLDRREYRIAQGFDSAAALVTDDDVAAAVAEERFTGEKSTGAFPRNAILYCLEAAGLEPADVDRIAHGFAYRPLPFQKEGSLGQRRYDEVYAPEVTAGRAEELFSGWGSRFVSVPHHLAHAASAFYLSGFDDALIVVADGIAMTPPRLLEQVRAEIRARHYSRRTEDAYVHWIRRFIVFHGKAHPSTMGAAEISARCNLPTAIFGPADQRGKARWGIEAGQAEPIDRAVATN
jgi:predicted NodU family carbamoyl transferase